MNEPSLILFFTRSVSLGDWISSGLVDREKIIYEEFLKKKIFKKVYWITYGSRDLELSKKLHADGSLDPRIIILEKNKFFQTKFLNYIYSFYLIFKFRKYFLKASILKTNQIDGSWSALLAKFIYRKPLFLRCGYLISKSERIWKRKNFIKIYVSELLEKLAFSNCDASTVTSNGDLEYLKEKFNLNNLPIVNPSFVDVNKFKETISVDVKRELLFIGRLSKEKNLFNISLAAKENNLTLNIIGEGNMKNELIKFSKREKIKINFLGNFPNDKLPEIINRYEFFIMCSESEGLPKSLLEAMAMRRICIGSNVPGIRDLISNNFNGLLSKSTYQFDISNAIKKALNYKDTSQIKSNARDFVISNFSLNNFFKIEQKIIEELL